MQQETNETPSERPIQAMWGEALAQGFTVVPFVLLRCQVDLGLASDDVLVLLHLISSWRQVSELPFPRTSTLAKRMGLSTRTVQRAVLRLENKGFVHRIQSTGRNGEQVTRYDLSGLVRELKKLAAAMAVAAPKNTQAAPIGDASLSRQNASRAAF